MIDPVSAVLIGTTVASTAVTASGQMAAASAAKKTGEYNAKVAENEAILLQRAKVEEEASLRRSSRRLAATQRVATAKSGVQMSGSPLQALADTYFQTERDANRIRYASDVEQTRKEAEAAMSRFEGKARARAYRAQAFGTILGGVSQVATQVPTGGSSVGQNITWNSPRPPLV